MPIHVSQGLPPIHIGMFSSLSKIPLSSPTPTSSTRFHLIPFPPSFLSLFYRKLVPPLTGLSSIFPGASASHPALKPGSSHAQGQSPPHSQQPARSLETTFAPHHMPVHALATQRVASSSIGAGRCIKNAHSQAHPTPTKFKSALLCTLICEKPCSKSSDSLLMLPE